MNDLETKLRSATDDECGIADLFFEINNLCRDLDGDEYPAASALLNVLHGEIAQITRRYYDDDTEGISKGNTPQ